MAKIITARDAVRRAKVTGARTAAATSATPSASPTTSGSAAGTNGTVGTVTVPLNAPYGIPCVY